MFAALVSQSVKRVTLKGAPDSYHEIAQTELYDWPLSSFVPGALKTFDLPDIRTELGSKLHES